MNKIINKKKPLDLQKKPLKKEEKAEKPIKSKKVDISQFAVFDHLNNQFKVILGEKFLIPYMENVKENAEIIFENVLMTNDLVGTPYLKKFAIFTKCLKKEVKDKKIIVFKYKSKKNYRVKTGHRQKYTLLEVIKFQKDYLPPKNKNYETN